MAVYKIELKAQGRPNLANGISLYVSDDRKVATWSLLCCEYVHGKQQGLYDLIGLTIKPSIHLIFIYCCWSHFF